MKNLEIDVLHKEWYLNTDDQEVKIESKKELHEEEKHYYLTTLHFFLLRERLLLGVEGECKVTAVLDWRGEG